MQMNECVTEQKKQLRKGEQTTVAEDNEKHTDLICWMLAERICRKKDR